MTALLDDAKKVVETVSQKSGKSEAEIEQLIEKKKEKFSGLLTDTGAAFMVAKDLGVELELEKTISDKVKVSQLEDGMNNVDLVAEVKQVFPPKQFEKGGKKGSLVNLVVADDTGETRLTLWNKDVKRVQELGIEKGDKVHLRNCYVSAFKEKPQLNLGYNGRIHLEEKGKPSLTKLSDLKPDMNDVDVVGRIARVYEKRTFETADRKGEVLNFELADASGRVRATAWNDLVKEVEKLASGDLVKIEGAYTKEGLKGIEVQLGWRARLLKNPKIDFDVPKVEELAGASPQEKVKISDLKDGDNFKQLNGIIVSLPRLPTVFKNCPTCRRKVQDLDGQFVCDSCGEVKPNEGLALSFELDDGFGVIRCISFGTTAERVLGQDIEKLKALLDSKGDEEALDVLRGKLVGRQIVVGGQAKKNALSEELEFTVRELISINPLPEKQVTEIMEELEE